MRKAPLAHKRRIKAARLDTGPPARDGAPMRTAAAPTDTAARARVAPGWARYVGALAIAAAAVALAGVVGRGSANADLAMVLLLGVLACGAGLGLRPALACAAACALAYNYLFLVPRLTLRIARPADLFTFGVFFVAALATGWLSGRVRDEALRAGRRSREVVRLLEFGRRLSAAQSPAQAAQACVRELAALTGCDAVVLAGEALEPLAAAPPGVELDAEARLLARWCADRGEPAGVGTGIGPDAGWILRPLGASRPAVGVAAVRAPAALAAARLLDAVADQAGVALERAVLAHAALENETLRQADRLRTALLNSLSHDLRTPLAAVLGSITTLQAYGAGLDAGVARDLLDGARDGAEQLDRTIANLLDLARLEGGALRPRAEWTDMRDVAAAAAERLAPRLQGRTLHRSEPADVAPAQLDPVLMEQALVNLLENALRHAPAPARVSLTVESDGEATRAVVEDDGPGVPRADRAAIFDAFRRGSAPASQALAGSGLGLSIARGFVEAMGGTLTLESSQGAGAGARFVARFPVPPAGPTP